MHHYVKKKNKIKQIQSAEDLNRNKILICPEKIFDEKKKNKNID